MADFVGVIDLFGAQQPSLVKRTALLFDKIALPLPREEGLDQWCAAEPDNRNDILWLLEQGILFQPKYPSEHTALAWIGEEEVRQISDSLDISVEGLMGDDFTKDMSTEYIATTLSQKIQNPNSDDETRLSLMGHFILISEKYKQNVRLLSEI